MSTYTAKDEATFTRCQPSTFEPFCCSPGCPDCSPDTKGYKEATPAGVASDGGDPEYLRLLDELRALHVTKSAGYGTKADPLANFLTVAAHSGQPAFVYPVLRAIEKLSRWSSLYAQGRVDELEEEHLDVASLLLCAEALRRTF